MFGSREIALAGCQRTRDLRDHTGIAVQELTNTEVSFCMRYPSSAVDVCGKTVYTETSELSIE